MALSAKSKKVYDQVSKAETKLGDLRNIAKAIKKDHAMAMELWGSGKLMPQLLAILIMDKKELTPAAVDGLVRDLERHSLNDRTQLADWLMANQLAKEKKTLALLESWETDSSALKRRLFWYHQGRLRWVGQTPPPNTEILLKEIETKMMHEAPEVQWAMNFTAGWIGVYEKKYRSRCVALGKKTGLYKDEMVSKGCTPSYLPAFIEIEAGKRNL